MVHELVCITCPLGCGLRAESAPGSELAVTGNRCPRGAAYAREELLSPKRTVTATARAACRADPASCPADALLQGTVRRVPLRTTLPFPKDRVGELLDLLRALEVAMPVKRGDVVLRDALGTGIDLIATRTLA